jgi:hypothetical protein
MRGNVSDLFFDRQEESRIGRNVLRRRLLTSALRFGLGPIIDPA